MTGDLTQQWYICCSRKSEKQKKKEWVVDPAEGFYFWWLCIITLAILFNLVFVIARACFEDLQTRNRLLWLPFDYFCDFFYILDIIVRQRTGITIYRIHGLLNATT